MVLGSGPPCSLFGTVREDYHLGRRTSDATVNKYSRAQCTNRVVRGKDEPRVKTDDVVLVAKELLKCVSSTHDEIYTRASGAA